MARRNYAVPELRRIAGGTAATEPQTAGGASIVRTGPASHDALTDVRPDQHHAQAHEMTSLADHPDYATWLATLGLHTHASEEFTAAGGSPETFTLAETPTGTRRVFKNGVRLPAADVGGSGDSVEVATAPGDVVTVDYEVAA